MSKGFPPVDDTYIMYGAEFSLYSGKLRSYLRKKGIPHLERLSNLRAYKQFIVPRSGVRFIPVIQTPDDDVIQDTTVIIDYLEKKYPDQSIYPKTTKQHLAALLLETFGDEWLVIPAMHYRWAFPDKNQPFIYLEFGKTFFPNWPGFVQKFMGRKLGDKFRGFLPMLGITEKSVPAIESSYTRLLADLDRHFEDCDFLLGDAPCIGDFGLIGPLYAHLYRDPYPGQLMRDTAPHVARWVERMISPDAAAGDFFTDDRIPESLTPILKRMAKEHIPVLLGTAARLSQWRSNNAGESLPRTIGNHQFTVEGVSEQRAIMPYSIWMWQRPLDYYQSLSEQEKHSVDQWLEDLGFKAALNTPLSTRVKRVNNKLVLD